MVKEVIPSLFSAGENLSLIRMSMDAEINETMFSMDLYSVSGPDGFSSIFFKKCGTLLVRNFRLL